MRRKSLGTNESSKVRLTLEKTPQLSLHVILIIVAYMAIENLM